MSGETRTLPKPSELPKSTHLFMPDPHSGKGLCMCERGKTNRKHPHNFVASELGNICLCGLPTWSPVHEKQYQGEVPVPLSYQKEVN